MQQLKITQSVTARDMTVNHYLADISRCERICPEEESELAARIQAGDEFSLTRERVRQIKEKAIRKMARKSVRERLVQYR